MLLPGPEAQQLADLHRVAAARGPRAGRRRDRVHPAGVLPDLGLSWTFASTATSSRSPGCSPGCRRPWWGSSPSRDPDRQAGLRHPVLVGLAAAAFLAIFVAHVPFPFIVVGRGRDRVRGPASAPGRVHAPGGGRRADGGPAIRDDVCARDHTTLGRRAQPARPVTGLAVWMLPLAGGRAVRRGARRPRPGGVVLLAKRRWSRSAGRTRCSPTSTRPRSCATAG